MMRAYLAEEYGGPDVLRLEEVERPTPSADEVVIRVVATSVNPLDSFHMRGEPLLARVGNGWRRPNSARRGTDVAGVVAALGPDVRGLAIGSRVYGAAAGAFAEYALTTADRIAPSPSTIDATSAAGLPVAAVTALQAVRSAGVSESGRVLVIGASGGVGSLVVQLAVARGAHVTAVCSRRNTELVRSLGAARVVDHTTGGLDGLAGPFDSIIDAAAAPPFRSRRVLLSRTGTYVLIGGTAGGRVLGPLGLVLRAKLTFAIGRRRSRFFIASVRHDALAEVAGLVDAGAVRPVIDRIVAFDELPDAVRYVETHRARGKVLVDVVGRAGSP